MLEPEIIHHLPDEPDRSLIHEVIYDELVRGVVTRESKRRYLEVIARLIDRGAAGIISSDYIGPPSFEGLDDDSLIGWGQNHQPASTAGTPSTFAFMVSRRTAADVPARLRGGPLVPEVMLNLLVLLYQPPTKMALLNDDVSPLSLPVVSQ